MVRSVQCFVLACREIISVDRRRQFPVKRANSYRYPPLTRNWNQPFESLGLPGSFRYTGAGAVLPVMVLLVYFPGCKLYYGGRTSLLWECGTTNSFSTPACHA